MTEKVTDTPPLSLCARQGIISSLYYWSDRQRQLSFFASLAPTACVRACIRTYTELASLPPSLNCGPSKMRNTTGLCCQGIQLRLVVQPKTRHKNLRELQNVRKLSAPKNILLVPSNDCNLFCSFSGSEVANGVKETGGLRWRRQHPGSASIFINGWRVRRPGAAPREGTDTREASFLTAPERGPVSPLHAIRPHPISQRPMVIPASFWFRHSERFPLQFCVHAVPFLCDLNYIRSASLSPGATTHENSWHKISA